MPALANVPAVARVSVRGTASGQAIVNIFHLKWTGGNIPAGSILYMASLVETAYRTHLMPRLNGNYSGDTVRAVDLSLSTGEEATVALSGTGGTTSSGVPQSAACCISWRINKHYRGGHPRTYLGPLFAAAIESPTSLAATYVAQVAAAAESFRTAINAGTTGGQTISLVAVHRYEGGVPLLVPQASPILAATVDTRIDTMRRRLGRDR